MEGGGAVIAPAPVDKSGWPSTIELEKWLMNTAKGADHGATFLRKMVQMNPSYGAYLAADEDLAGIVQLFAKRFRTKIMSQDASVVRLRDDTVGKVLWEPLCEMCWRVVGHMFHTLMDLEESDHLPVPREALGQVRMLLNTNVVLSKKLNDVRRAYFKEICVHRDRERILSQKAQAAIAALQQDQIMFYEPLDFVLDENTKHFIYEIIEERLKLDMEVGVEARQVVQEPEVDDVDPEKAKMLTEMRKLRTEAAKQEAIAEKAALECARAKAELEKLKEVLAQREREAEDAAKEIASLREQLAAQAAVPVQETPPWRDESPPPTPVHITEKVEVVKVVDNPELAAKFSNLQAEVKRLADELKKSQKQCQTYLSQLEKAKALIAELQARPVAVEIVKEEKLVEKVKPNKGDKDTDLEDLKRQLAEQMNIAKQLRDANKALEKAMDEGKERAKYRGPKGDERDIDAEIKAAVAKIAEEFKAEIKKLGKENDALKEALERERNRREPPSGDEVIKEKVKRKRPETEDESGPENKGEKWKEKCKELQDQNDDLLNENEQLKNQIRTLLDKIKKYGGESAVAEAMAECKIDKLPPRKQRRKKAWERLYEDAQRRINDMRKRQEQLQAEEKRLMLNLAARVTDRRSLRQVERLTHLQKAAAATQSLFHNALSKFHSEHGVPGDGEGDDSGDPLATDDEGGQLGAFFRTTLGITGSLAESWKPELIAAEFQRLRSENRMMSEEIDRLRYRLQYALSTGGPVQGARGGLGIGGTSVTKAQLMLLETGMPSPNARTRSPSPFSPDDLNFPTSPTLQQPPTLGRAVTQPALGPTSPTKKRGANRPPPPPPLVETPSITRGNSTGSLGQTMPWRQMPLAPAAGGGSPSPKAPQLQTWGQADLKSTGPGSPGRSVFQLSPLGRTLPTPPSTGGSIGDGGLGGAMSASMLLANGGYVPWRKTPPHTVENGGAVDYAYGLSLPAGWNPRKPMPSPAKTLPPDAVLGRVPSTASLEPIAKATARTPTPPKQQRADSLAAFASVPRSADAIVGGGASGEVDAAPSEEVMTSPPSLAATTPLPSPPAKPTPPRDPLARTLDAVKPKASGLCVTALRSQEHLRASFPSR